MKKTSYLVWFVMILSLGLCGLSFAADFEMAQPNLSPQKQASQQKNVSPTGQMVPAISPDLEVRIVSIGTPIATNRDPFSGRIEDSSGPEEMIPVYVIIPFSVAVKNSGRAPARPIRVSVESEGGMPPAYRTFSFNVAGSMLPTMIYLDEPLAAGAERNFTGTIISNQFTLPLYRSDAEGVTMRFRAVVDPEFSGHTTVRELNESNNNSAWSMPMNFPRATISVSAAVIPKPDLRMTIDEIIYKKTLGSGSDALEEYDINFTMFNNGTARYRGGGGTTIDQAAWTMDYFAESNRRFYPDGWAFIAHGGCIPIESGSSAPLRVDSAQFPPDTTKIRVIADPGNNDDELNEDNNIAEKAIIRLRTPDRSLEPIGTR